MKKSLIGCWLALSIPFLAASCADLKDADRCYRVARLSCQKSCLDKDEDHCIEQATSACHADVDLRSAALDECADKLDALPDCAGNEAVRAACATSIPNNDDSRVGGACDSSSDCAGGLSCINEVCTASCEFDDDCDGRTTLSGAPTYCNGDGTTYGVCIGTCQTSSECAGDWICEPNGDVKTCGPSGEASSGKLGDPCDFASDCNGGNRCSHGYCTDSCFAQSSCSGTTSAGGSLACVRATGDVTPSCLPTCIISDQCASGTSCTIQPTPDGDTQRVCADVSSATTPDGTQRFGEACSNAIDCVESGAKCEGFCTENCSTDGDCATSSGTRLAGRCATVSGQNICLPGCSPGQSGQCEGGSACVQVTSRGGVTGYLCRPGASVATGRVGDSCTDDGDCTGSPGLTCNFGMCVGPCTANQCPNATAPRRAVCVSIFPEAPDALACTVTCDQQACVPGWTCAYDDSSGQEICTHALN